MDFHKMEQLLSMEKLFEKLEQHGFHKQISLH